MRIDGKDFYLGPYGSDESHASYERLIAEWRAQNARQATSKATAPDRAAFDLTLTQVIARYRDFAREYYAKDGEPRQRVCRDAVRPAPASPTEG